MRTISSKRNCQTATKATTASATEATSAMGDFRPSRKCFSFSGCLFAILLLLTLSAQQASCRPGQHDELLPPHFNVDEEFRDVDNLEIHRVKVVNGVMRADHPIVMYKEDFVDENYVPTKNATKPQRKYKDIAHRRRHKVNMASESDSDGTSENFREAKTEKIYFDFVPETPIVVPDENEKRKKPLIKLVPLSEELREEANHDDEFTKDELLKRPKKFHRRVRRDTGADGHVVHKRNPFFRHDPHLTQNTVHAQGQTHFIYIKHAVPGKKHNGLDIPITKRPMEEKDSKTPDSFDNRIAVDEEDRVIFASGPRTTSSPRGPTRRPDDSIFRDPRPENWDFSFMNQGNPPPTTPRTPVYTRRPATTRAPESIFRDPSPENYDFSFMNQGQQGSSGASQTQTSNASRQPTVPAAPPRGGQSQSAPVSQCVWAIVNCCSSRNTEIRYSCFEQNGCYGAFWGLNPCAESVRDSFVGLVADYYN